MRNSSKAAILAAMIVAGLATAPSRADTIGQLVGPSGDHTVAATDWRPRCHAVKDGWMAKMACPGGTVSVVGWSAN